MRGMLTCEAVEVAYGGLKAVDGVSLEFPAGRLTSLIGPNGAGKTTLMNALSGQVLPSAGRVILDGADITRLPPHARSRAGLGRSFQITKIFAGLSVLENLRVAALAHRYRLLPFWLPVTLDTASRREAEEVLENIRLARHAHTMADSLSHGDQRALEVGLTLLARPRVLLLDEPLAGVGHDRLPEAIALIRRVTAGRTVVLIEHNMDVVMEISDTVVVMAQGRVIAAGPPAAVRTDSAVRAAYLGADA